jgi:metal-responsive CopG/Arc/MetJ family transcriptional regulator
MRGQKAGEFMDENNEKRLRIGITILPSSLQAADNNIGAANCKSRSEFIEKAITHYAGYLAARNNTDFLAKAITEAMQGVIKSSEDRLSRLQFKEAVELAKLVRMIAPLCEVTDDELQNLHAECVDEVKRINGIVKLDSVLRGEL